ncbi:MAG: 4-(cytidine 5'-diphospho)-2-C-methyl-D-erythritol kinase [Bacteroidetes bacterium]|nr:4-(cytidine 5'-diphospho)-2-C-methyl-D-erythritol kinase [Bacteroidota bacterium]
MQQSLKLRSYAKINIGLRVLGKRPDGYHDIETLFYEVLPFDELTFTPHSTIELTTNHPTLPTDATNLCIRAACALKEESNYNHGVHIHLAKTIPLGAGLGGGSSNAATTLIGLNQLWGLHYPPERLVDVASRIGSDVAFFIRGGCAYATGRGDQLKPIDFSLPYWILIALPPIHISTPWAYNALNVQERQEALTLQAYHRALSGSPKNFSPIIVNDFERVVFEHYPIIREIKESLLTHGAVFALLSGSGSSVFGFYLDENCALKAKLALPSNIHVFLTPPNFHKNRYGYPDN